MCLIAFAIQASVRWPLVIASNRDEYLHRPTLPLAPWQSASGRRILSGRDLRAGGTWLGMTDGGRVAFLTNVRQANTQGTPDAPRSRGELVLRWLESGSDAAAFTHALQQDRAAYGGFNLVLGDIGRGSWTWVSNREMHGSAQPQARDGWCVRNLAPGIYGLSNAALDTPWPKTTRLKNVLASALAASEHSPDSQLLSAPLWTELANRQRAPEADLPHTGVPLPMEHALSSTFVEFPEHAYGTRCSTLLVARCEDSAAGKRHWEVTLDERTHVRTHAEGGHTVNSCRSIWKA